MMRTKIADDMPEASKQANEIPQVPTNAKLGILYMMNVISEDDEAVFETARTR